MISINNIKVVFGENTALEKIALNGLSLEIKKGEFVTVVGANGAGKSTLLGALAGDVRLSGGSIRIDGDCLKWGDYAHSIKVSRVFQDPQIGTCAELTVLENMALALARGKKRGLKSALTLRRREKFQHLLSTLSLGLDFKLDTPIGQLSGGQRQAISLLMATLSPLKVLLLDEHTSALDPKTAATVLQLSSHIVEEQALTAFMVTHSLAQALEVGTRTLLVREGKIARDWSGEEREKLRPKDLFSILMD